MDESIDDYKEQIKEKANATRRNLDNMGSVGFKDVIFGSDDGDDRILVYGAALIMWVLYQIAPPGREGAILVIVSGSILFTVVGLGIYLSPESMTAWQWVKYKYVFWRYDLRRSSIAGDPGRISTDAISTAGNRNALEDLTRVDGYSEAADGIWRFDGALVGGTGIKSAEMSLAQDEDWEQAADELGDAINSLNITGQFRSASTLVDTEAQRTRLSNRLGDPDVAESDQLKSNVAMYKRQLPKQMESKNASIRGFQFTYPVTMEEVKMSNREIVAKLADLPIVGNIFENWSSELSIHETRFRQEQVLKKRREQATNEMSSLTGCDAHELSLDQLEQVLTESWTGRPAQEREETDARAIPVVSMERQFTESDGEKVDPSTMDDEEINDALIEMLQSDSNGSKNRDQSDVERETEEEQEQRDETEGADEEIEQVEVTEPEVTGIEIPDDMLADAEPQEDTDSEHMGADEVEEQGDENDDTGNLSVEEAAAREVLRIEAEQADGTEATQQPMAVTNDD